MGAEARTRLPRPGPARTRAAGPTRSSRRPTRSRPRSSASPASTRSSPAGPRRVPPHARARARRGSRARRPARRRHPHGPRVRSGSGSTSSASTCAVSPKARSPPGARRLAAARHRPARDRRRAAAARSAVSTTTTAACWPRSRPRATARVLLFPRGDLRRTTERMPSRFLLDTVEALTGTRRYADDCSSSKSTGTARSRRSRQASRACRFPRPNRSTGCARCSTTPDAAATSPRRRSAPRDAALDRGLDCTLARASARVHALRRQPRRPPGPEPGRRRRGGVAHAARALGAFALRLPDGAHPPGGDPGAPRGGLRAVAPRPRLARARDARRVPARGPRPPGGAPSPGAAVDRRRSGPAPRDRRRAVRRYEAAGSPGGAPSGTATAAGSSPTSTGSSPKTPSCAPTTGSPRSPPSSRFGLPAPKWPAIELVAVRRPPAAVPRCRRPGRRRRRRHAARHRLQDRVSRSAVGDAGDPTSAGTQLQLPVYALAARSAFGNDDTPVVAAYWFVSTRGRVPVGGGRARRSHQARFDEVLRVIVDGIEHGVFPCSLDPPGSWHAPWRTYADPDARGHARPLPRLGAQARRARARRLRRARGARRRRRVEVDEPEAGVVIQAELG